MGVEGAKEFVQHWFGGIHLPRSVTEPVRRRRRIDSRLKDLYKKRKY